MRFLGFPPVLFMFYSALFWGLALTCGLHAPSPSSRASGLPSGAPMLSGALHARIVPYACPPRALCGGAPSRGRSAPDPYTNGNWPSPQNFRRIFSKPGVHKLSVTGCPIPGFLRRQVCGACACGCELRSTIFRCVWKLLGKAVRVWRRAGVWGELQDTEASYLASRPSCFPVKCTHFRHRLRGLGGRSSVSLRAWTVLST